MAVTVSGMYVTNWIDTLDTSALGFNFQLTTHKIALHSNSLTPNFSSGAGWTNGNEVSGTGWAAGGPTIATVSGSPTLTESPTGSIMYDMNDVSAATTTLSNARCCIIYADAITTPTADPMIVLVNFGADYSTSAGTFGIQWAATGVFAIDITP